LKKQNRWLQKKRNQSEATKEGEEKPAPKAAKKKE
jgi:hypothetical protein